MAISSIISFGLGNGTFSPGVGLLPTLGYGDIVLPYPGKTVCFQDETLRQPSVTNESLRFPSRVNETLRQPTVIDEELTSC